MASGGSCIIDPDDPTQQHTATAAGAIVGGERYAVVFYDRQGARAVHLQPGEAIDVGRSAPAMIQVADPSLSRCHARFERREDGVWVVDLNSTNGVRIDGKKVKEARLLPGAAVLLGAVTASLHVTAARGRSLDGLLPHELFRTRVGEEAIRSRRFGRPFAVLCIQALEADAHIARVVHRIRNELREVDRLSVYSRRKLLVMLPEGDAGTCLNLARKLVAPKLGEPTLRAGVACFPEDGADTEALLGQAIAAARSAKADAPARRLAPTEQSDAPLIIAEGSRRLYDTIARVAPSHLPVLLTGETGSGKELAALAVHRQSGARSDGPLRSVNCGALTETLLQSTLFGHAKGAFTGADSDRAGLFEAAHGGTLFLDEVGELSPQAQAALLRVLETSRVQRVGSTDERPVDVRVVAATHRDLHAMAAEGSFRQDLLYRLEGIALSVPPLRERREEILPLAKRFLERPNPGLEGPKDFSPEAIVCLQSYPWPGNVRELKNAVERAAVIATGSSIGIDDLPARMKEQEAAPLTVDAPASELPFKEQIRQYEVGLILQALQASGGNQTQAAKALGMPLRTLVHKIRSYGIKKSFDAK